MKIVDHQLIDGVTTLDLPHLPTSASLMVWRVPLDYRANGLFVAVKPPDGAQEVPACDHGAPAFIADLPAHPETLLQRLKSVHLDAMKAERDRRRFNGGVNVSGHWFLTTAVATSEYVALSMLSVGLPANTVLRAAWRTMDGTTIDMTPELVRKILGAGFESVAAIDDAAQAHRVALEASSDPSSYSFASGWPMSFEDAA